MWYQTNKEVSEIQQTDIDQVYTIADTLLTAMQPEGEYPDSAERQYAVSTLKDAVMWAVRHIAGETN